MTAPSAFTASLSPAERAAYGRNARKRASRSCHGRYETGQQRPDPVGLFAQSYADQNERDYEALRAACRSGRIRAER